MVRGCGKLPIFCVFLLTQRGTLSMVVTVWLSSWRWIGMYRLTVTLSSGKKITRTVLRKPRHWKSWLMQQAPYGTAFYGCSWTIERI